MPIVRDPLDPQVSQWHFLAFYLRFLREKEGLSLTQCGKIISVVRSTVSNMEAGRVRPQEYQLAKLDERYGTGVLLRTMLWYARMAHDPDWGQQLIKYEEQAESIRIYHGDSIPRPFQTEGYMRALLEEGGVEDAEEQVAARMARQQDLLGRGAPPLFWVISQESVLACEVGGRSVMREQLEHLLKMMNRPNIIFRFVQLAAGAHHGFDGPFHVIRLDGRDVAYAGAQNGGRLIEVPSEVREFWTKFEYIGAKALPQDASRDLVERYLEQFR